MVARWCGTGGGAVCQLTVLVVDAGDVWLGSGWGCWSGFFILFRQSAGVQGSGKSGSAAGTFTLQLVYGVLMGWFGGLSKV